jgi:hypothetical protein
MCLLAGHQRTGAARMWDCDGCAFRRHKRLTSDAALQILPELEARSVALGRFNSRWAARQFAIGKLWLTHVNLP